MDDIGQKRRLGRRSTPHRGVRIQEVAKLAEVSTATVSRALASPQRVSPEKRARVLEAIAKTGYTPNLSARSLRSQKTGMILVVLPDLANTFFSRILRGIEETLFEAGYGMIISDLDGSPEKEAHFAAFTAAGRVDGAILLNGHLFGQSRDGQGRAAEIDMPIVALCESIPNADIPQIEIDNRAAARKMTQYLASRGHRRILYVSGPTGNVLERERYRGYRDGLRRAGLSFEPELVVPGDYTIESGMQAGRFIVEQRRRPSAVFCTSDEMAIGLIRVLLSAGIRVPQDISVAGFDDIEFAVVAEPALTTIRQPRQELGRAAASALIALLQKQETPRLIRLETELVIRDSVAEPRPSRDGRG
ncbi:LacI family DNA-binding transcriptional regulator [Microvirga puerhi]|uniref:LacI family transcriptional regulator n=1 Tax=Microvirga puerhi TaxID=2876078 RepID=A0ABS7VQC7_9HYPH|nr:LacI family DNA-binding transcriptional regulator [Microvirga puerhi]MBZ6077758.1 LacI family transcriptional regulator [Microvirga puerhi]